MSERLIPVKSFDELQVGMIVVFVGCAHCGESHRLFLVGHCGSGCNQPGLCAADPLNCDPGGRAAHVTVSAAQSGRLYRVDDGLEALGHLEASRPAPRKLTRAR